MKLLNRLTLPHALKILFKRTRCAGIPLMARRRTRRSALVACAIGFLLFALLHVGLVLHFRHSLALRDPVFHHRFSRFEDRLRTSPRDFTVVAIGSSRVQNGWMGGVVEETLREQLGQKGVAFNFAIPGGGPIANRLTLERLMEKGVRPDHVIVEIFQSTMIEMGTSTAEVNSLTAERIRESEIGIVARYGFDVTAIRKEHAEIEQNPWNGLRYPFFDRIDSHLIPPGVAVKTGRDFDANGSHPVSISMYPLAGRDFNTAYMKSIYAPCLAATVSPHAWQAVEDFLALCREHKMGVTFLLMPEGSAFRSWYPPGSRELFLRQLNELAAKYPCHLVDAQLWMSDDDFVDGHHLYDFGARQFSKRFAQDHLVPLLAKVSGTP